MAHFVLVHGGMIGGNCWDKLNAILQNKNHTVTAPTLTGLGEKNNLSHPRVDLETHIQDVLETLPSSEPVILVGHSYAGMVITGVADRIPHQIHKLIYLAAVFPKAGESMLDAVGFKIASHFTTNAQQGNGWEVTPGEPQAYGFTEAQDIEWFKTHSTPHPIKTFQQKLLIKNGTFDRNKTAYIHCTGDVTLEFMTSKAMSRGIECHFLEATHFPMITQPKQLAELLNAFT